MVRKADPDADETFDLKDAVVSPTPKLVRIRVHAGGDGELSCVAGTATVIDGCIFVYPEDAPTWLATIDGLRAEED
jgi:hypothetical protein